MGIIKVYVHEFGYYSHFQNGVKTSINYEQIKLLNEIGFEWAAASWEERYEELKVYVNEFGNAIVPRRYYFEVDTCGSKCHKRNKWVFSMIG